jgi:hypothetical protein
MMDGWMDGWITNIFNTRREGRERQVSSAFKVLMHHIVCIPINDTNAPCYFASFPEKMNVVFDRSPSLSLSNQL